ncbi:MAG: Lrp/AsnC family transcriptional regulator [Candidatus Aminicenantales bacterium]
MNLDNFDKKILDLLSTNAKISNAALAREIGLTPPATLERVRKLEKNGFILGYKTVLDKNKLGKGLTCFVALHLAHHNKQKVFQLVENSLKKYEEIEEIHLVTGRYDYLIKIHLKNVEELREFIIEKLTKLGFISKVETFVAISSLNNANFNLVHNIQTSGVKIS